MLAEDDAVRRRFNRSRRGRSVCTVYGPRIITDFPSTNWTDVIGTPLNVACEVTRGRCTLRASNGREAVPYQRHIYTIDINARRGGWWERTRRTRFTCSGVIGKASRVASAFEDFVSVRSIRRSAGL